MREFARATVTEVEAAFGLRRDEWEGSPERLADDAVVRFFLEGPETAGSLLYHAMIDLGGGATSEPVFFGELAEVPNAWLHAPSIRLYFAASLEEFLAEGYLDPSGQRGQSSS